MTQTLSDRAYQRWMAQTTCPRCQGGIPNDVHRGEYAGALSRTDRRTGVCSACGVDEAMEQFGHRLTPQKDWPSKGGEHIQPVEYGASTGWEEDEYIVGTYKIAKGRGIVPQIENVLIHLDLHEPDEIPKDPVELVQYWVSYVLDNQIDNDHERLGEIGERG